LGFGFWIERAQGIHVTEGELKRRTKEFGLRALRVADALPRGRAGDAVGRQLVRCGLSVGANYRAACRAKSPADFAAKLAIVEEELDEAGYWLEIIADYEMLPSRRLEAVRREANDLLAIVVALIKTIRRRANPKSKVQNPKSPGGPNQC
jgi:four helix bundle protein